MNWINIVLGILLLLACVLFVLLSIKKGKWQGYRVVTSTVIALLLTLLYHHKLGQFIVLQLSSVEIELILIMEANGVSGLTMLKVLSDTMVGIASYIVAPILFIILFWVVYFVFKIYMIVKPLRFLGRLIPSRWFRTTPTFLQKIKISQKMKNLLCGVVSGLIVLAAVIFLPNASLFRESAAWIRLANIISTAVKENTAEPVLSNADFIVGQVFDTDFIAATDDERLELINRLIMHMALEFGLSTQDAQALVYHEKEKLIEEVPVILNIYNMLSAGLPGSESPAPQPPPDDAVEAFAPEDITVSDIEDLDAYITSLADNLYSLQASDVVVRIVIEQLVHTTIGNDTFVYPEEAPIPSTDEMKQLLSIMQEVVSEDKEIYAAIREVTANSLLPIGVINELQSYY
ncbi:MAG: hypothetical protein LBM69_07640 [Lachnospiraceae bacterium]|nr:hypothetical protein [Lachnospiraceae bacterium]